MIPEFPNFKKLELGDRADIEAITSKFPPYSDFNFVSMWCWDIKDKMRLSILNGNLAVRFSDYLTGEAFYSFIGDTGTNETAKILLEFSEKEGLGDKLRLVPEISVSTLDAVKFNIKEDRDNFDYIYEVENLIKMSGRKFAIKRKHFRFFKKNFTHDIRILDLNNPLIREGIVNLFNDWAIDKGTISTDYFKNEFLALSRFLNSSESIDFFAVGIYQENELVAASISENTHNIYNLGHFQKCLVSTFKGLNDYLVNELAKMLVEKKVKYMNSEQDLGLLGLRESKESYMPFNYLKKFSLSTTKPSFV